MVSFINPWICVQAWFDHDSVNEVVHYTGDAIETAKSLGWILLKNNAR
jgi:hypothetical protein